ncbi:single-stranded DNA-binding protein [Nostoc sp. CENA543]|uniref:single-stranded DNA-binding protein n=1 Tax=Nostoc sp. CENA543 TaxID=1869241 RepID=UPI000CA362DA|nr:single-stranded DNA-binding protein [Nostoc sp. CENA543]AUT01226.1 single-stranded DNA-binding protein [Nostoc sp. CENA543]
MSINIVTLVGRVGGDPDMKFFDSGKIVCKLTLAVNRRSRNDKPDWFTLEIWNKQAEAAGNYVRKGRLIAVKGSLKFDTWNDRQSGQLRSTPVILVDQWEFLDSKRDSEANGDYSPENF